MSQQPTPASALSSDIERRVATRFPCPLTTSCRLLAALRDGPAPVRVRNISATGISLVVPHACAPGTKMPVELKSVSRNITRSVEIVVVYCIDHPSGESILGGAFTAPLPEEDLRIFVK